MHPLQLITVVRHCNGNTLTLYYISLHCKASFDRGRSLTDAPTHRRHHKENLHCCTRLFAWRLRGKETVRPPNINYPLVDLVHPPAGPSSFAVLPPQGLCGVFGWCIGQDGNPQPLPADGERASVMHVCLSLAIVVWPTRLFEICAQTRLFFLWHHQAAVSIQQMN